MPLESDAGAAEGGDLGRAGVQVLLQDGEPAAGLQVDGVTARGYAADVRDPESLVAALCRASEELGTIEVLEYSPIPQREFLRPVLETTVEDLTAAVEFSVLGPVTAVRQVLPGMRSLGRGTVLFVNGGSGADKIASV